MLFETKLLNMFKIVSLKIVTCISIFLLRKSLFQFTKSRAFRMLDTLTFL